MYKNIFSYSLIIFFSTLLVFTGLKNEKISKSLNQLIEETKIEKDTLMKDTLIQKLPDGYQYISNFSLKKNKKIISISQDSSGIMLFVTNTGISFFDGTNEKNLYLEDIPNKILKDPDKNLFYVACQKGFGVIEKNKFGEYTYRKISEKNRHNENYFKIIINHKNVYFINDKKIVSINKDKLDQTNIEYLDENKSINYAFFLHDELYLNFDELGLYLLTKDAQIPILTDTNFNDSEIIFDVPYDKFKIIGTDHNKLFIFNGKDYSKFHTSSSNYIEESIINGGINYNNENFVVTTINGGAIMIDKKSGKTLHTINYRTGLPDDEIFSASACNSGGLWLAHEYGISRVAFDIPVKNYGNYPGIQGKVNSVMILDSILYVATGEGVFHLSEIKSYEEVKVATDKWVKSNLGINNTARDKKFSYEDPNGSGNDLKESTSEETGFFRRLKNRKTNKKNEDEETTEDKVIDEDSKSFKPTDKKSQASKNNVTESPTVSYKKITEYRKIYELQSIKYAYKKMDGINSKCKEFKKYKNGLLALTNSGLFFIKDKKTFPIISNSYIYNISGNEKDNVLYATTSDGIFRIVYFKDKFISEKVNNDKIDYTKLRSLYKLNDSIIWAGFLNKIYNFKILNNRIISTEQYRINSDRNEDVKITKYKDKIIFIAKDLVFYYDDAVNNIIKYQEFNKNFRETNDIFFLNDTSFVITGQNRSVNTINTNKPIPYLKYAWLFDYLDAIILDEDHNIWIISADNMIYKITPEEKASVRKFTILISDIKDNNGNSIPNFSKIVTESDYKRLIIQLSTPCFLKNDFVNYYYGIDTKNEKEYIEFSRSTLTIPELTPGNHSVYIFAVNNINEKSETIRIEIIIKPPFWQTSWFMIIVFILFILFVSYLISAFYTRKQRKIKEYNEILELKVKERTFEIQKQNKLIQKQNTEILDQNKQISFQNEEITGSIRYAGKIQRAALSDTKIHSKYLTGFFILFKPRDIVSGDFFWIKEAQDKLFVAAVDCTGHGVPGGFLSMLGISFLNEIVSEMIRKQETINAGDILNELRKKIITTLSQHEDHSTQDGMDMSVVVIDKANMLLNYAGANNSAIIIRNKILSKLEADRMPIGYNHKLNHISFSNKFLKLEKEDTVYLFTDGYADQFGGKNNKKFNLRRFRELLIHLQNFPIIQQEEVADKILQKWQMDSMQIDDILLIGLQI